MGSKKVLIRITLDDLKAYAREMDMHEDLITPEVFDLVKQGITSGMFAWGLRELKASLKDAIVWALKSA